MERNPMTYEDLDGRPTPEVEAIAFGLGIDITDEDRFPRSRGPHRKRKLIAAIRAHAGEDTGSEAAEAEEQAEAESAPAEAPSPPASTAAGTFAIVFPGATETSVAEETVIACDGAVATVERPNFYVCVSMNPNGPMLVNGDTDPKPYDECEPGERVGLLRSLVNVNLLPLDPRKRRRHLWPDRLLTMPNLPGVTGNVWGSSAAAALVLAKSLGAGTVSVYGAGEDAEGFGGDPFVRRPSDQRKMAVTLDRLCKEIGLEVERKN
jgi:hypothetical protein